MASFIREKVSKNKRRYKKDGFDLDLTYITERIIAMGFPSIKEEAYYRNPLPEVQRFFEHYHSNHYKLYNLCAEREYDIEKFHSRVSRYPFYDHNAPPVALIQQCCDDVAEWLAADDKNIVGINCKAGKGRTGLIICCYLLHSGICSNADEAMKMYGERRTKDGKGVTIASQIRYIRYYERVLQEMSGKIPDPPSLKLTKLVISATPMLQHTHQYVTIEINNEITFTSPESRLDKKQPQNYDVAVGGRVEGDCRIQLIAKNGNKKIKLCHFWFNTGFVDTQTEFLKATIDVANKDKKNKVFKPDFSITCVFEPWTEKDDKKSGKGKKNGKGTKKGKPATSTAATTTTTTATTKSGTKSTAPPPTVPALGGPTNLISSSESDEEDQTKNGKKKPKQAKIQNEGSDDDPSKEESKSREKKAPVADSTEEIKGRKRNKSFYSYTDYKRLAEAGVEFEEEDTTQSMDMTSSEAEELASDEEGVTTTTLTTVTSNSATVTSVTTSSPENHPGGHVGGAHVGELVYDAKGSASAPTSPEVGKKNRNSDDKKNSRGSSAKHKKPKRTNTDKQSESSQGTKDQSEEGNEKPTKVKSKGKEKGKEKDTDTKEKDDGKGKEKNKDKEKDDTKEKDEGKGKDKGKVKDESKGKDKEDAKRKDSEHKEGKGKEKGKDKDKDSEHKDDKGKEKNKDKEKDSDTKEKDDGKGKEKNKDKEKDSDTKEKDEGKGKDSKYKEKGKKDKEDGKGKDKDAKESDTNEHKNGKISTESSNGADHKPSKNSKSDKSPEKIKGKSSNSKAKNNKSD